MKNTLYSLSLILCFTALSFSEGIMKSSPSSLTIITGKTDQERVDFLVEVAQAYLTEGSFKEAIDVYERILEIDPEHQEAKYNIPQLYISIKEYVKSEKYFLNLIDEFPDDFSLFNNLAWLYATAEDPSIKSASKSLKFARKALVNAPQSHHVWSTLSECYYVNGDYEEAYRASLHANQLIVAQKINIDQKSMISFNAQVDKCKRALDTRNALTLGKSTDTKTEEQTPLLNVKPFIELSLPE